MRRTRVKICGLTRSVDVRSVVENGVDAIGIVLHPSSPRFVPVSQAIELLRVCGPFVQTVALFMDEDASYVHQALKTLPFDLLQFHGEETADYCEQFGRPYIKAVPMGQELSLQEYMAQHPHAAGFLLDSHTVGEQGGSGKTFDWHKVPRETSRPLIVAGGLSADNVADAIKVIQPYAVDVSSGVEIAKGIKDPVKIELFMQTIAEADHV